LVYEEAEGLRLTGAAVTVWPSGSAALARLGVRIEGLGRRLDRLETRSPAGRSMFVIDGERLNRRFGVSAMGVPRRRLLERLAEAMPPDSLRFAHACRTVRPQDGTVRIEFDNGMSDEADLVVGGDGHRSAVRSSVFGGGPAKSTGWAEWQGLSHLSLPLTDGHVSLTIIGKHGACGLMPAGDGLLQWWFATPWSSGSPRPPSVVSMLQDRFGSWMSPVPDLLRSVSDADVNFWPYVRHRVPKSLVVGRVVLIGDAAHAMPPTLAQGANSALDDAAVLTHVLRSGPVSSGLRTYDLARRRRVTLTSRLAARPPAQDPDAATAKLAGAVPPSVSTWFFGSFLRMVSTSLAKTPTHRRSLM
jgi:FAD-dependent urate hydroxylase